MKLSIIQINNYRQLDNVTLSLHENITVLAGPNNSGKTTAIALIRGILSENKVGFTKNDIPVHQTTKWLDAVFPLFLKYFFDGNTTEQIVEEIETELFHDGILKAEYSIEPCEAKIQVDYDVQKDDIRSFAEYIMDLDETKHSFYFVYAFSFSFVIFKKLLLENSDKLKNRLLNLDTKKDAQKTNVIRDMLMDIYANSLVEETFFTDSRYSNRCKMEISDFKKLFNFKSINAVRQLDDTNTDSARTLSKSMISLASKDETWKSTTKNLPDSILNNIQGSGVEEKVREASVNALSAALESLTKTNGGHIGEILLQMDITEDDVSELLKKITCAKYHLDGHYLNESSQGLGYSNMIYLHMQLEAFKKSINPFLVNVFFIEEPESHMHPQMQNVFIKYLLTYYQKVGLQGLITTHSNEMVRVTGLEHLRVIRETQRFKSEIFDLSAFRKSIKLKQEQLTVSDVDGIDILANFFDWFFEIGFSEIIFADKAILYEGDTERLYIKKLITLPNYQRLSEQYIAYIQVGGAYAYNYKELITFLKIKTLIITDLDYVKTATTEPEIFTSISTNSTINHFYQLSLIKADGVDGVAKETVGEKKEFKQPLIERLYEWKENEQNKLCDNLIYLTFQEKDYLARTLEEAMLSKMFLIKASELKPRTEWKRLKSDSKLLFTIPNNNKGEEDSLFCLRDIVLGMSKSKTDFMYSVIMNSLSETMLPLYIEEGLKWLMKE